MTSAGSSGRTAGEARVQVRLARRRPRVEEGRPAVLTQHDHLAECGQVRLQGPDVVAEPAAEQARLGQHDGDVGHVEHPLELRRR